MVLECIRTFTSPRPEGEGEAATKEHTNPATPTMDITVGHRTLLRRVCRRGYRVGVELEI